MIRAVKHSGEDLGFVGEIESVDVTPINDALKTGYIPVISTIGGGYGEDVYNINADTAAARIAACLHAEKLLLMTDVRGLLRDKEDEGTLIPVVNVSDVPGLKNQGIISGGMIPKTETALKALEGDAAWEGKIIELAAALDSYIPEPERAIDLPFLLPIEDVFSIAGRGTVVTGRVERGVVKVGEEVAIIGIKETTKTTCTGVEMFRKLLDEGRAGENVGVLLRGIKREDVERGQVLAKPGTITPHTKFESEVYVLSKEEGGRHTPFFKGYRPQFYFRTTDVTGTIELPEGVEMVMPGDNIKMVVTLIAPIAMDDGLRFAIREGGRTVGAGVVAKVIA